MRMGKSKCCSSLVWLVFGICLALFVPMAWGACGGGISGNVTDSSAGPIAGVSVKVFNAANGVEVASTTTAYYPTPGGYSVTGLPSGNYRVSFDYNSPFAMAPNGYLGEWYDNKSGYAAATNISVASAIVTGKNAALAAAGSIGGTVTDGTGAGLVGVQVNVFNAGHTNLGSAVTAPDGSYTVMGLPTGSYRVSFDRPFVSCGTIWYSGKSGFSTANAVAVTADNATAGIDATFSGGRIAGVVKDAGSLAELSSIYVSAYNATTGIYSASAMTDDSGAYDLGLPPGSYKLFFDGSYTGYVSRWYNGAYTKSAATAVTVTNNVTTTVNQNLAMGATVSGTVTDGASPVEGVIVTAYESSLGENDDNSISTTTDADGNYTLQGLRSGVAYKINFDGSDQGYLEEWYNNQGSVGAANPVTPPNAGINATLARGGTISGTIQGPCGALENILVIAADASHTTVVSDLTAANGSFSLKGLPAGTYTVTMGNYSIYALASRTAVVTVPNTTTVPAVTLSLGGSISGRVTDTSGWGLDSAAVAVVDGSGNTLGTTTTDANGYYVVGGLPTGSYRVQATYNGKIGENCVNTSLWYNNQALVAVTAPSGTTGINITLGGAVPTATLTVVNGGGGTVTSSPAGISCPGTCSATLPQGVVVLTGQYNIGYAFTGWSGGGCSGTGTCQVNLSSNTTVTATFTASSHTLQVTVAGDGKGTVTSSPAGFTCSSGTCSKSYGNGYQLTLNATPSTGSVFGGWSGGLCAGTGPCALTLTGNTATTATFSIPKGVRMNGSYYQTILAAYTAAADNAAILARDQQFSETLNLNRGISVSLEGGYDADFLNSVGVSTLTGPLTISSGQVEMGNFVIK